MRIQTLSTLAAPFAFSALVGGLLVACGAPPSSDEDETGTTGAQPSMGMETPVGGASAAGGAASTMLGTPSSGSDGSTTSQPILSDNAAEDEAQQAANEEAAAGECGSFNAPAAIQGVVLAFVFDVSASMGSHTREDFDRDQKWEPVVSATKAFFEDPNSSGIQATLTFFPNEHAELTGEPFAQVAPAPVCAADEYAAPDVA